MSFTFKQAKDIVLVATYETLLFHAQYETFGAEDVHKRVDQHFSSGFVRRVLGSLAHDELVTIDQYDESSPSHYTVSDKGLEYVEELPKLRVLLEQYESSEGSADVPASDRIVSLDHNAPQYSEIEEALDQAITTAKSLRPNDVSGDEHSSLVAGLEGARSLWKSFELTKIQFEVGILLAVERAEMSLKTSFQLVKGPLLMEALKHFFEMAKSGINS